MSNPNPIMTIEEVCEYLWSGLLEEHQVINQLWLEQLHKQLKVGGIWAYPEEQKMFRKIDKYHMQEVGQTMTAASPPENDEE